MNTNSMIPETLRLFHRWHRVVALVMLALLLLLPWTLGIGPNSWRECLLAAQPSPAALPRELPAVPAPVARSVPDSESLPSAKVYFELSKFQMPSDGNQTLAEVVSYLKEHADAKVVLSGYHDPHGDQKRNEELAHNRARAVRTALGELGIVSDRVIMDKPQVTTGTGTNEEARRVEVRVQP